MRDRISREKKRKDKAATKIQALIRRKLATVIVDKRRKEVAEEKRLQEKLDDLEKKLEELHSEWLEEIIVIRAQTGVRGMLGRKAFVRKSAQMIKEAEEKFLKKKIAAAVSVQVTPLGLSLYINLQYIVILCINSIISINLYYIIVTNIPSNHIHLNSHLRTTGGDARMSRTETIRQSNAWSHPRLPNAIVLCGM